MIHLYGSFFCLLVVSPFILLVSSCRLNDNKVRGSIDGSISEAEESISYEISKISFQSNDVHIEGTNLKLVNNIELDNLDIFNIKELTDTKIVLALKSNVIFDRNTNYNLNILSIHSELKNTPFKIESSYPKGAVVPFDQASCPSGWSNFTQMNGRFVLGSGVGNLDIDSNPLTQRQKDDSGGIEFTTAIPASSTNGTTTIPGPDKVISRDRRDQTFTNSPPDTSLGGDLADSNMPPFVSLKFCKKD